MGWSLQQLGDKVGLAKSAVLKYERGDNATFRMAQMVAFAQALGVDISWLMGLTDDRNPRPAAALRENTKWIPLLGTIAAGEPIIATERIESYVAIMKDFDYDFALRVKGESMANACIHDGSMVLCRKQEEVENGQVAVVIVDGDDATLKRFFRHQNGIIELRPANPDFQPMLFAPRE